jgi:hypothetical protein
MKTLQSIAGDYLEETFKDGYSDLGGGVTLSTAAHMVAEQKSWDDEDPSKGEDFYSYLYWITTDNAIDPIGIDSAEDLIKELAEPLGWDRIVAASAMGSAKGGKKAETARKNGRKGGRPGR